MKKNFDLLEYIFLAFIVIDAVVLSVFIFLLTTIITICIFLGSILFIGEFIVLLYQAIKTSITISIFSGLGFLGVGIIYGLISLLLVYLLKQLIKVYPKVIKKVKHFIGLKSISKEKKIKTEGIHTKNNLRLIIIAGIISLVLIIIAALTGKINTVFEFIQTNFEFRNIYEVLAGGLGL